MSEPSSLVMRVHVSQAQWAAFLKSEIQPVRQFTDWSALGPAFDPAWLDKVDYGSLRTVEDWFAKYLGLSWPGAPPLYEVDWSRNLVTCVVLEFGENFIEYVHGLNVLRRITQHKTSSDQDFIVIYPYFWDPHHVVAAIALNAGKSRFLLDKKSDNALRRNFVTRADELIDMRATPFREFAAQEEL